jgi:hypothetical protein
MFSSACSFCFVCFLVGTYSAIEESTSEADEFGHFIDVEGVLAQDVLDVLAAEEVVHQLPDFRSFQDGCRPLRVVPARLCQSADQILGHRVEMRQFLKAHNTKQKKPGNSTAVSLVDD